jgi:hypothetical protein
MTCNGMAMSKVIGCGMIEISGCCYDKNGEEYVVDFACAKCRRVGILHNLTDIHRNASAGFGLHVDRVPVAYHRSPTTPLSCQPPWPITHHPYTWLRCPVHLRP